MVIKVCSQMWTLFETCFTLCALKKIFISVHPEMRQNVAASTKSLITYIAREIICKVNNLYVYRQVFSWKVLITSLALDTFDLFAIFMHASWMLYQILPLIKHFYAEGACHIFSLQTMSLFMVFMTFPCSEQLLAKFTWQGFNVLFSIPCILLLWMVNKRFLLNDFFLTH